MHENEMREDGTQVPQRNNREERAHQQMGIQELHDYCKQFIPQVLQALGEVLHGRHDDTDEFLVAILDGIDWIAEVAQLCEQELQKRWQLHEPSVATVYQQLDVTFRQLLDAVEKHEDTRIQVLLQDTATELGDLQEYLKYMGKEEGQQ